MAQSRTLANIIPEINDSYYLPAIQRTFEWEKKQIRRLFDSILRDYPIGSFLFWKIRGEEINNHIKYEFIEDYVSEAGFPKSDMPNVNHYNNKVEDDFHNLPNNITLVLDGQQRLSSFYIGLFGSYTDKGKYKTVDNKESYTRKKLYINLLSDPEKNNSKMSLKYDLSFREPDPPKTKNSYWYELGEMLDADKKYNEIDRVKEKIKKETELENIPNYTDKILARLYDCIYKEKIITFFEVDQKSEDEILDIFIRANEAGTPLKKPDLVLSLTSSVWKDKYNDIKNDREIVAREEIAKFRDKIDSHESSQGFNIETRYILRNLLACSNLNSSFEYSSFKSEEKLKNMKKVWMNEDFKKSVTKTLDLINSSNLNLRVTRKYCTIPITYYIYKENPDLSWSSKEGRKNRKKILLFIFLSRVNSIFKSKTAQIIDEVRRSIKKENNISLNNINNRINNYQKSFKIDETFINDMFDDIGYNNQKRITELTLTFLYELKSANPNKNYQIDHLFPKSKLTKKHLIEEKSIDEQKAKEIEKLKHNIGNLQILTPKSNMLKNNKDPEKWNKKDINNIEYKPNNIKLEYNNYIEFTRERRELMKNKLKKINNRF